jgi:hypothetical protein
VDPVLTLTESAATVDPGGEARLPVTVRNVGDIVEQYRFEVLGDAARWAQVLPREVSVLPHGEEEKTVEVVFRPPPAPAAPAGEIPFGVRCVSLERRDRCAVVEGDVAVGAVHDLAARLEPVSPVGRWTGRYRILFDNSGTVPVTLSLAVADSRRLLRLAFAPRELTVAPGQSAVAYLAARPRQPMLRGRPVTHSFTVTYRATGDDRGGELSGSFDQRPILSKAVLAVGLIVLVAGVAGVALLLRRDASGAAQTGDGPPPPTALTGVEQLTDASAQLVWEPSPYASGYVVQQVLKDGTVAAAKEVTDRDQTAFVWTELKPGRTCFQVVTVAASGRSAPSEPSCLAIAAPTPTPTETEPTPTPTDTASGGDGSDGGGDSGPGGQQGNRSLQGYWAIYAVVPMDDAASQGSAERLASRLQAAGSRVRVADSREYDQLSDGQNGLWVVLQDGFESYAAARQECEARAGITDTCFADGPG